MIVQRFSLLFTIALLGCGSSDSGKSPAVVSNPLAEVDEATLRATPSNDQQLLAVTDKPTVANTEIATPAVKPTPAQTSPPTVAAPAPVARPSAEQIQKWTRPAFDPLKLVGLRDWEKTTLVTCTDKTADGSLYVLGGPKVTLWSIAKDQPEKVLLDLSSDEKNRIVVALEISPDQKWLAAGDTEGRMKIWSLPEGSEVITKDLYKNDITQIAISPDSQHVATISFGSEVSIWNAKSLELVKRFKVDDRGLKEIVFATPTLLAVAGEKIATWDIAKGSVVHELSPGRYNYLLARSPDNKTLIYGVENGMHVWDIAQAKDVQEISGDYSSSLLEFSPDQKYLAIADKRKVSILDLSCQQVVQSIDVLLHETVGLEWLPKSNLLVVASDNGRTRIWGTENSATAMGLKTIDALVNLPNPSERLPASAAQILAVIDLRSYPRLPGWKGMGGGSGDERMLVVNVPVDPEEARMFYRYFLSQDGWKELPPNPLTPNYSNFTKNGFRIFASFTSESPNTTQVNLTHLGNVNPQWIPKVDVGPVETVVDDDNSVIYKVKADLLKIETDLLRKMHAEGWTAYSRLHSTHNEETDSRDLEFLKGNTSLRTSIQKFADSGDSFTIHYTPFWVKQSVPIPRDSGFVEFDGSVEPHLVATTSMKLDQTREFYDAEMAKLGFRQMERGRTLKEEHNWLTYMRGQQDLTVGLVALPNGRTLVRVGADLENSSWQLAKPKEKPAPKSTQVGIEAADMPILHATDPVKYDADKERIEFRVAEKTLASLADDYTTELEKVGFKPKGFSIREETYVMLDFVNGESKIEFRANRQADKASISLQGSGVFWNKPLPLVKQVVSYEQWLRKNRLPAGLDLLEKYESEMRSLSN